METSGNMHKLKHKIYFACTDIEINIEHNILVWVQKYTDAKSDFAKFMEKKNITLFKCQGIHCDKKYAESI